MKDINKRILEVRNVLNLSMRAFGDKIGISASSINKLEKGENNPSDQTLKLICKEFNVDYFWLIEGTGDMFTALPDTLFDELADEYHLDKEYKVLLKTFLQAQDDQKECIKNFLLTLAENLQKKDESWFLVFFTGHLIYNFKINS